MSFWSGLLDDNEAARLAQVEPNAPAVMRGPRVASLLLSYGCDLSCTYCSLIHRQAHPVGTERWKATIDRLADAGVRRVSFSGGEPALRSDLPELVRHATARGCLVALVTNGLRLMKQLGNLEDAGLKAVTVSLDSADPDAWRDVRGGTSASHSRIVDGIRLARSRRRLWVGVNLVLSRASIPTLPLLLSMCREFDVALQVQPVNPMKDLPDMRPTPAEANAAIDLLVGSRPPVTTSVDFLRAIPRFWENGVLPFRCHVPDAEVVIAPDLSVQPCCVAGSVGPVDRLDELWNGEDFAEWRSKARRSACRGCMLLYHDPPGAA